MKPRGAGAPDAGAAHSDARRTPRLSGGSGGGTHPRDGRAAGREFREELAGRINAVDVKVDRFREELAGRIDALDVKVDRFREELAGRIDALDVKVDRFREELADRIDALDHKMDRFREELAGRIDGLDGRIDGLDHKISRQFLWIVGVQLTVLLAVIGALLGS